MGAVGELLPMTEKTVSLFWQSTITMVQLALAVWLFARTLPHRDHESLRVFLLVLLTLVGLVVGTWTGGVTQPELTSYASPLSIIAQYALFTVLLFVGVAIVLVVWDTSVWTAFFCCTIGFAMQNLATGLSSLYYLLASCWDISTDVPVVGLAVNVCCTAFVYGISYLLLIRKIERRGLVLINDRKMVAMSVVIVFMVIGFDVANKFLYMVGFPLLIVIFYKGIHGGVCALTMLTEYELLYAHSLQSEIALSEQMMVDQERQWRLSKETVNAINAKTHAVRHHVLRLLANSDANIDRGLLQDVSHELDVYDTSMHTGNEALDVILTSKLLIAEHARITLSCIANGILLREVSPTDLHELAGTALDCALAATNDVDDQERRAVKCDIRERAGMVVFHVEGYCRPGAEVFPPRDLAAMQSALSRYDGVMTTSVHDDLYKLNVMFPTPEE